jgi:hypothetical protein
MAETSKAARSASTSEASTASTTPSSSSSSSSQADTVQGGSSQTATATGSDREVLSPIGVKSSEEDWALDVDGAREIATAGGRVRPGMSMMDVQGSAYDIPEVFDEYQYYENERVNNAAHLRHRFDERQIDWDLTSRKDLADDGVTSEGVKIRERSNFTRSRKSDQDR